MDTALHVLKTHTCIVLLLTKHKCIGYTISHGALQGFWLLRHLCVVKICMKPIFIHCRLPACCTSDFSDGSTNEVQRQDYFDLGIHCIACHSLEA